jgi:GTPase SAR1 family protein
MTKYAQLVLGTAGTGKSTYCRAMQEHCASAGRSARVGNLDPAAEAFGYQVCFDVRELVSADDVMQELQLGPNGALVYAMEFLAQRGAGMAWLDEQLEGFGDDDYLILDCPGQIELCTHVPVMQRVAARLRAHGFNVCVVYCVDALFVADASKLISANLAALSVMMHLELPHVNVLTKCDLVADKALLERFSSPSGRELAAELRAEMPSRYRALSERLASLLDDFGMVGFFPLDITDEESVELLLMQIDHAIQYGEEAEPKEPRDEDEGPSGAGGDDGDGGGGGGYDDGYGGHSTHF